VVAASAIIANENAVFIEFLSLLDGFWFQMRWAVIRAARRGAALGSIAKHE
jgi:hypothetical protein